MLYGSWKIPKAALSAPIIKHSQINKGGNTMANVTFNEDLCKGCGLCVDACPKKILRLSPERINVKGHHPAENDRPGKVHCLCFLRHHVSGLRHYRREMRGVTAWQTKF